MILATDLDRTLLPNGHDPYDGTLPLLVRTLENLNARVVYVTGRNLEEFMKGREEYEIPFPEYLIAEVGTGIYRFENGESHRAEDWDRVIRERDRSWDRERIVGELPFSENLYLQEEEHQNRFKISLYIHGDEEGEKAALEKVKNILATLGVQAHITESFDPLKNTGLIDILPAEVNKSAAIEFVMEQIGDSEVLYCGDSGNDIAPLTFSEFKAIVVKNAPEEVKKTVTDLRERSGSSGQLYIAEGEPFNGNYSSGILEGLLHFGYISKDEITSLERE